MGSQKPPSSSSPTPLPDGDDVASIREDEVESQVGLGTRGFFVRRWRCEVPAGTLIVRDMLVVGTLINLFTTAMSLLAFANGVPTPVAIGTFFLPLPYNLFLFACGWRLGGLIGGWKGTLTSVVAALWLVGATVL